MFGSSDDEEDGATTPVGAFRGGDFDDDREVRRLVDEEAGVVVYGLLGGQSAGLAAVPLEETDLDVGEWGSDG